MEQPARSPDYNPIDHIWHELGHAITSIDILPQNLGVFRQALLDKWAEIPIERLQCLLASMLRCLGAIIIARGGNTRFWPSIHKTTTTGSIIQTNQVCLTRITIITIQWHVSMPRQPTYPIQINVITNIPKYTLQIRFSPGKCNTWLDYRFRMCLLIYPQTPYNKTKTFINKITFAAHQHTQYQLRLVKLYK